MKSNEARLKKGILWLVAFMWSSMGFFLVADETPPNIVLIFTDDQGYQDIGCFGSPLIKTPNLDRMAEEGVRLTDFYSANSVCSPSRAALLTGCYPNRVGVTGVLFPRHSTGLNPSETTIAEILGERGYATACFGKWHLGHKKPFLPTNHGFDSYFGIPYSNDMSIDPTMAISATVRWREGASLEQFRKSKPKKNWVPLFENGQVVEYPADQTTLTQRYTERALAFIESNKERPFFLYLPHTMPHIPLFASDGFRGKSARGPYGDTIEEIDDSVGQILAALDRHSIADKTLVIYTSDNGPWKLTGGRGGSAYPLRGYKFSTYEGGMRVPCIMRWPSKIPAGSVCREIAATIDLLPTLSRLAGCELPTDVVIDGRDIRPLLFYPTTAPSPPITGDGFQGIQFPRMMHIGNRSGIRHQARIRRIQTIHIGEQNELVRVHCRSHEGRQRDVVPRS